MTIKKVPQSELKNRMTRFTSLMDETCPNWELCCITGGVGLYYFTGTICDGVLLIRRSQSETLWVRRSYERALLESEFHDIKKMSSFRDIANFYEKPPKSVYLDTAFVTMEWYNIFNKYMNFENVYPVDRVVLKTRAVKTPYEIDIMQRAGKIIDNLLSKDIPAFLCDDISEAELGAHIFNVFIKNGYHGLSRFSMKNTDVVLGHVGFAESSLYPSIFNGASGLMGLCPAVPVLGSLDVKLKKGDLIYVDPGFGLEGYNVDRTVMYSYKESQPDYVIEIHNHCLELEKLAVSMLSAGVKPSDIYNAVLQAVKPELKDSFMGVSGRTVPFLGHGVGLFIDEHPVIAKGFDEPMECGMTIAIEPKIGIKGVGMVGSENTYLITETGAVSLTGGMNEIMTVK